MDTINWATVQATINPVIQLRDKLAMSRKSLALASGISYNTLHFAETGIINSIPNDLHVYFNNRFADYSSDKLNQFYSDWVLISRRHVSLPPVAKTITYVDTEVHPFQQYLNYNDYTIMGFCTLIKLPKNVIYHYIKPGRQEAMPFTLATALKQCNMSPEDVQRLDDLGRSHYNNVLKTRIDERRAYVNYGDRAAG